MGFGGTALADHVWDLALASICSITTLLTTVMGLMALHDIACWIDYNNDRNLLLSCFPTSRVGPYVWVEERGCGWRVRKYGCW
jgi:hypothetical protein